MVIILCLYILYKQTVYLHITGHNSDRDLKPGNLLVSKDCQLRITDFGLARYMDEDTLQGMYVYYYPVYILYIHVSYVCI